MWMLSGWYMDGLIVDFKGGLQVAKTAPSHAGNRLGNGAAKA
jgi:hypothetical protein